eukprot:403368011
MIIVDQMRDMLMRGLNSKLGREVQSQSMDFIYNNQKQLMWGFGALFGFIALITSPIWITMAVLSSPFIIAGVLLFMYTDTFNPIIKFLIRQFFELYTSNYQKNDLTFLNGGYADSEIENGVFLKTYKDKFDVLRIQLYNYIVMRFGEVNSMNGLNLLETGCGRGGGLHYLAREMNPQSALGIDIARSQIEYCKKHWMGDKLNLNFIQHDVENLESIISRNTIDYAIDIESSMFYPNKSRFFREISKALRRDGVFLFGTMMSSIQMKSMETKLCQYFEIVKSEDITREVVQSLKLSTKSYSDLVENNFPRWTHWLLKQAYGIEGTYIHRLMENRTFVYKIYQCKRKTQ